MERLLRIEAIAFQRRDVWLMDPAPGDRNIQGCSGPPWGADVLTASTSTVCPAERKWLDHEVDRRRYGRTRTGLFFLPAPGPSVRWRLELRTPPHHVACLMIPTYTELLMRWPLMSWWLDRPEEGDVWRGDGVVKSRRRNWWSWWLRLRSDQPSWNQSRAPFGPRPVRPSPSPILLPLWRGWRSSSTSRRLSRFCRDLDGLRLQRDMVEELECRARLVSRWSPKWRSKCFPRSVSKRKTFYNLEPSRRLYNHA